MLAADGAHSIFSTDPRPKRTISTLMGWWEGFDLRARHHGDDLRSRTCRRSTAGCSPRPTTRVNIGICMDGEEPDGRKTERNVREVFAQFLDDHYRERLVGTRADRQIQGPPDLVHDLDPRLTPATASLYPRRSGAHHAQRDRRGHLPRDAVAASSPPTRWRTSSAAAPPRRRRGPSTPGSAGSASPSAS